MIDALVSMFTDAVAPLGDVLVLDGPEAIDMGSTPEFVVVGDDVEGSEEQSTFNQSWAGLGAQSKAETGSVVCTVVVRSGESYPGVIRDLRNRALEILAACEAAQRANLNFGGLVLFSAIESGGYRPVVDAEGTGTEVTFNVTYEARI